jgi:NADH-quinone oxidoreductase subunit H
LRDIPVVRILTMSSFLWLFAKVAFVLFLFLWFRATFPRYRYDQIMRLGWKVFIPITLVWIAVVGLAMQEPFRHWPILNLWFSA